MNLRKEQVLFLVVVVVGALWYSDSAGVIRPGRLRLSYEDYEPAPAPVPDLPESGEFDRRGTLFREPTESIPLPPAFLQAPPMPNLPLVWPPLSIGQRSGAMDQLVAGALAGARHEYAEYVEPAEEIGPDEFGPEEPVPDPYPRDAFFDSVWIATQTQPLLGRVLDQDKYQLEEMAVIRPFEFQQYRREQRTPLGSPRTIEDASKVRLADTLENRIALRRRAIEGGPAGNERRIDMIRWLLEEGRNSPFVFATAEELAEELITNTPGGFDGWRWMLEVVRAQGDPAEEFKVFDKLGDRNLGESGFALRERGRLASRLTLWGRARTLFQQAIEASPRDAYAHALLAELELGQGRIDLASAAVEEAQRTFGSLDNDLERADTQRIAIEVALAAGDADAADQALGRLGSGADEGLRAYLEGAIAYAKGSLEDAHAAFVRSAGAGDPRALHGRGLAAMRQGNYDEARWALELAATENPALRGHAQAGLAALHEVAGHPDLAREATDAALVAAPMDPYVLYLAGRRSRLEGASEVSVDQLRQCLSQGDEFALALAESVRALLDRGDEQGEEGGPAYADAARYADRLVQLDTDADHSVRFLELQGLAHARINDLAGANRSYREAVRRGSDFADLGLALLDYRRGRARDARERLSDISNDGTRVNETQAFARATVVRIDDHASKEQVLDNFDRDDIGGFWLREGSVRPEIADGQIRFERTGTTRSSAGTLSRSVPGSNFLGAEIAVSLPRSDDVDFVGLRLQIEGRFELRYGFVGRSGSGGVVPQLTLQDGNDPDDFVQVVLSDKLSGIDPADRHRLVVEAVPILDEDSGEPTANLGLVVRWNGQIVHRVERLKQLRARGNRRELLTLIEARGAEFDARFDDYRLVRRNAE